MMTNFNNYVKNSAEVINSLSNEKNLQKISIIKNLLLKTIDNKKLIMIGGNGGSACDAEHFCAELVVRYKNNRKPVKCISINSSISILTASSNDFGYEYSFARSVECFSDKNNLLIILSTSGNSKNILKALQYAQNIGMHSIALLGKDGGLAKNLSEHHILVDSYETALIQQAHIVILHYLAMEIENYVIKK